MWWKWKWLNKKLKYEELGNQISFHLLYFVFYVKGQFVKATWVLVHMKLLLKVLFI